MKRVKWYFLAVTVFPMVLIIQSCNNQSESYSIIEFAGEGTVTNCSNMLFELSFEADSGIPAKMIAGKGDIIAYEDYIFQVKIPIGQSYRFESRSDGGYINGRINTIFISKKDSLYKGLREILSGDLSGADFLCFEKEVPQDCETYLSELVQKKPDLGLCFDGGINDPGNILKMFNPGVVFLSETSAGDIEKLSQFKEIKDLMLGDIERLENVELPALPSLKQLIIFMPDRGIPGSFFRLNPQIERLAIFGVENFDLASISNFTALKSLTVLGNDSLLNSDLLNRHQSLEVLSVSAESFNYNTSLDGLGKLKAVTFSSEIRQEEFKRFIDSHSGIEVVNILQNEEINDLSPLLSLERLYGLTVSDTVTDVANILLMKDLRYLSLPSDFLDDSLMKNRISQALPGTIIAPNEGFCLGSGWLLLLIPLILLFRIFPQFHRTEYRRDT